MSKLVKKILLTGCLDLIVGTIFLLITYPITPLFFLGCCFIMLGSIETVGGFAKFLFEIKSNKEKFKEWDKKHKELNNKLNEDNNFKYTYERKNELVKKKKDIYEPINTNEKIEKSLNQEDTLNF